MRTCKKCGAEAEKDDKYCPECGEKLVEEVRTITVWGILKVVLVVIFFVIMVHIFKNASGASPVLFIIFIILFIIWSGVLNWFLGKLFNVKISTGVKLIISIAILLILFFGANMATKTSVPMVNTRVERPPTGEDEVNMYNIVGEINSAFSYKNDGMLTAMFERGVIASEVFEDLKNVPAKSRSFTIILNPQNNRLSETHAEMDTEVLLRLGSNERRQGAVLVFEKRGPVWVLIKISPRLSEIKLEKSFEEAVESKMKEIPKPVIVKIVPGSTKEGYY